MNEKIVLMGGKGYLLAIGDTSSTSSALRLIFQATKALEDIVAVFSDIATTGQIKIISEDDSTLVVYNDCTVLGSPKSASGHYLITPEQYGEDDTVTSEAVYGRVAMLKLLQPTVEAAMERNRANIDFLTIVTGADLQGGKSINVKELAQEYYPRLWDIDRLKALVTASRLSEADYKEVTGKSYKA